MTNDDLDEVLTYVLVIAVLLLMFLSGCSLTLVRLEYNDCQETRDVQQSAACEAE